MRLINLSGIPIFNDEAIYLDWSWRQLFTANNLFYSLYDAKPPLLLWLFGIAGLYSQSLLIAGRVVGVLFGFLTMLGIFSVAKEMYTKQIALLASLAYIIIPIFSFFDRQALMESSIGAVGVWLFYGLIQFLRTKKLLYSVFCGIVFGLGLFIKPNSLLFLFPILFILIFQTIIKKISVNKFFIFILIFFVAAFIVLVPLLLQPMFWETLSLNNRYTVNPSLGIKFIEGLFSKILAFFSITFIHLGPLLFLLISLSFTKILKNKKDILLFFWITIPVIISLFTSNNLIERYIVSFIPLITIMVSQLLINTQRKNLRNIVLLIVFSSTFVITLIQIFSPSYYFQFAQKIYSKSFVEYTKGFSSGYGVPEVISFLEKNIGEKPAFIATAFHTGNPESGVMVHFMKKTKVLVSYLEGSYLPNLESYDCLESSIPVYYVTRETDTKGLDRFLKLIYFEKNVLSDFGIGVYTLKSDCVGKTLKLEGKRT